jgi:hypothetical protein
MVGAPQVIKCPQIILQNSVNEFWNFPKFIRWLSSPAVDAGRVETTRFQENDYFLVTCWSRYGGNRRQGENNSDTRRLCFDKLSAPPDQRRG